jgi:hypothetical protein
MTKIFSQSERMTARREAVSELVGAVNTTVMEGDVIEEATILPGDDTALLRTNTGYFRVILGEMPRQEAEYFLRGMTPSPSRED